MQPRKTIHKPAPDTRCNGRAPDSTAQGMLWHSGEPTSPSDLLDVAVEMLCPYTDGSPNYSHNFAYLLTEIVAIMQPSPKTVTKS